jgi:hypothetical protein
MSIYVWADDTNPAPVAIEYNTVYPYTLRWTLSNMTSGMFRIIGNEAYAAEPASIETIPEPAPIFLIGAGLVAFLVRHYKWR